VPLSGAQAAALLRIGGEPMRETERADGGTNGMIFGAAAHGATAHEAPTSRTAGRITLAVLGLMGFSVLVQANSEQVPPNAPQSSGLVGRAPDTGASHVHDTLQGHHKMLNKITGVTAAAVVGIAATVAGAQSGAVQWRAADGGNGHWYAAHLTWLEWDNARTFAESIGGHLATVSTAAENEFVADRTSLQSQDYWLGAKRTGSSCSPPCLEWITGEPWTFEVWVTGDSWGCYPANPNACGWNGPGTGTVLEINGRPDIIDGYRKWNDESPDLYFNGPIIGCPSIIEWSADCNSDGIVDYGQCHDGTLPDYNSNNIPDICEQPRCQDADITNNQIIDGADLGALLAFWGPVNPVLPQADVNRDGQVNGADIGLLLSHWGPCP
jgi:hypothetical protein